MNFSIVYYDDQKGEPLIAINPVKILTATRSWSQVKARRTHICYDLHPWLSGLLRVDHTTRDYFLFLLLTGCRKSEGLNLKWSEVFFDRGTVVILNPKNGVDHEIPLSDILLEMFQLRKKISTSDYVFPGHHPNKPMHEGSRLYERVSRASGIPFTSHWLRRSFSSIADYLDIPHYCLKRLLNHKSGSDMTLNYIVRLPERYREPIQRITDCVFNMSGISKE